MRLQSFPLVLNSQARLILLLAIDVLAAQSYASTVSVSTITFQAQYGLTFDVISSFTVLDREFNNITLPQAASLQPCLWLNGTTCQTTLTSPHLQYSLALTLNTPPLLLTIYTVTVQWSQNGGPQTQMGILTVSVSAVALAGQQMTFDFDTGNSSFASPLSINVIVA